MMHLVLKSQGITDLVLDVTMVEDQCKLLPDASMITGQFSGFSKLEWNSNYSDNNTNYIFQVT
jgi:hypothetical protein